MTCSKYLDSIYSSLKQEQSKRDPFRFIRVVMYVPRARKTGFLESRQASRQERKKGEKKIPHNGGAPESSS